MHALMDHSKHVCRTRHHVEAEAESGRDVLVAYGRLIEYKPKPTPGAACYDGLLALRGFGPNPADAADVLESCATLSNLCRAAISFLPRFNVQRVG